MGIPGTGAEGNPVGQLSLPTEPHCPMEMISLTQEDKVAGEGRRKQTRAHNLNLSPGNEIEIQAVTQEAKVSAG